MSGFWWFLAGGGAASAAALLLFLYHRRRRKDRLSALTDYLEAAGCGRETVLSRVEDEFSLLEDEIYKTVSELRIAREQEERARHRQADNLADIAHQLKTPLTSMSLMLQLLAADAAQGQQEYMERMESQLTRLEWLTDSLLTMSRLDAGTVDFLAVCLPFEELAARALEPVEQLLEDRSQEVCIRGKETLLDVDPHWTAEALVNLIKNSSEHTPAMGVIILAAEATPLYLQITVEDSGTGFDPEELHRVFCRFYRGKNSSKDSVGIGLALSRSIVEGQGGMIRAENRAEGGARFVIRFYTS